ncbi:MAG: exodeoxyribonuclease VII large subunit, partial [Erysipelotrichaceae bacterium]|nr:exodeoxyribonuclease VII large subunit [Erysipelotrichaceae bacterium]
MSERVFSVSDILTYLKKQFSNDYFLTNINVEGEIGNFTNHSSGHWYFTLKDNSSLINCCMFHMNNVRVGFVPKNGDKVILKANVSIYERSGQLQLVATAMKLSGEGDFYVQFEKMKKKLAPLGYF